ncbi:MAG: transglycosylase domain-containing protein [Spirochaetia bacterium]|nr:transglycosylase domain-containing protein [Spirochaetia bacterium]
MCFVVWFVRAARRVILYLVCFPLLTGLVVSVGGYCAETRLDIVKGSNFVALEIGGVASRVVNPPGYTPLSQIPSPLVQSLIYQEDRGFFSHRGYRLREMFLSVWDYVRIGRPRGASTITQQLARTLFLGRERTLRRKLNEMRLARLLEERLSKDEILELYLNHVYWGDNTNGIAAVSMRRLHKKPLALTPDDCAFLVSLLPAPDACPIGGECDVRTVRRYNHILARFKSEWKNKGTKQKK